MATFGETQPARSTRCWRSAKPARPNIVRLIIFSRLMVPSTGPVLQGSSTPAWTVASSWRRLAAKRRNGVSVLAAACTSQVSRASGSRAPMSFAKPSVTVMASSRSACASRSVAMHWVVASSRCSGRWSTGQIAVRGVRGRCSGTTTVPSPVVRFFVGMPSALRSRVTKLKTVPRLPV